MRRAATSSTAALAALDGTLFLGALDGRLIALDAATGKVKWSMQTFDKTNPTPSPARRAW